MQGAMRRIGPTALTASLLLASLVAGCEGEGFQRLPPSARHAREARFSVEVHTPEALRGLHSGERDALGHPVAVGCPSCHGVADRPPELATDASQLEQVGGPHEGLRFEHGALSCASCHDPSAPERFHLADGRPVALADAMSLCAQCHGPQKRDYDHGAHGGMRGHWDLSAGPRDRNHCLDCHDTHRPAYPRYLPVFRPVDRFLVPKRTSHAEPTEHRTPEEGEHG